MSFQFQKAVAARLFATLSAIVCGIASLKLYSNFLTPEIYGVVLVALQILNYLPLVDAGFRTTVNRHLLGQTDCRAKMQLIDFCQTLYTLLFFAIVFLALVSMVAYSFTEGARDSGQSLVFFIALGMTGALTVAGAAQSALLIGLENQSSLFLLNGINSWISLVALWFSLALGTGVWAFPISALAGQVVIIPASVWLIRRVVPTIQLLRFAIDQSFWVHFKTLKSEALSLFRSQVVTMLLYTLDLILVAIVCSPKDAAVYGVLTRVYAIIRGILQSTGEAAWPIVARRGLDNDSFGNPLLHVNAWVYGGVMGTLLPAFVPLSRWFLGAEWTSSPLIVSLVAARYLITGLATPASYILFGLGEIKTITRCLQRELAIALIAAFFLGWKLKLTGIAVAFLLGTAGGTLLPLIHAYAAASRRLTRDVLAQLWFRALSGFLAGYICTHYSMQLFADKAQVLIAASAGLIGSIGCGLAFSFLRTRNSTPASLTDGIIYRMLKNM